MYAEYTTITWTAEEMDALYSVEELAYMAEVDEVQLGLEESEEAQAFRIDFEDVTESDNDFDGADDGWGDDGWENAQDRWESHYWGE